MVWHKLNRELVGGILWLGTSKPKIKFLTWLTEWWRQWGKRSGPVKIENLELAG